MKAELLPGSEGHAASVARLSEPDRAELEELTGDGHAAVRALVAASARSACGLLDGRPIFLGGVTLEGWAWMLGAPDIARARAFYLRSTRAEVEAMQAMFPVLRSRVDVRYTRSLRWLRWLGFTVGEPRALGSRTVLTVERVAS